MSYHNSTNWPQRSGNKWTLEVKMSCTQNIKNDAGKISDDQIEGDC